MKRKRRIAKMATMGMLACLAVACHMGGSDGATEEEAVAVAELVGNVTIGPLVELWVGEAILDGDFDPQGVSRKWDAEWESTPDGGFRQKPWSEPRGQLGKFNREWECPEGGTVSISGNNKDHARGILGSILGALFKPQARWYGEVGELRVKARFDHCARTSREGLTMALTGTVEKELDKTFIHEDTWVTIGMRGQWTGKVAWQHPDADRSGVCKIDGRTGDPSLDHYTDPVTIDMVMSVEHGNRSRQVEGDLEGYMCGQPVYTENRGEWLTLPG